MSHDRINGFGSRNMAFPREKAEDTGGKESMTRSSFRFVTITRVGSGVGRHNVGMSVGSRRGWGIELGTSKFELDV